MPPKLTIQSIVKRFRAGEQKWDDATPKGELLFLFMSIPQRYPGQLTTRAEFIQLPDGRLQLWFKNSDFHHYRTYTIPHHTRIKGCLKRMERLRKQLGRRKA